MFTQDNTEGFNQETLDKMNAELEAAMEKYDPEELGYDDFYKGESGLIFNKYC